jgi:ClpX C4-type zinc finger
MEGHSLTCTFCRRSEHQVHKLVAGPGVYICDACVEIAHRIVRAEEPPPAHAAPRWRRAVERIAGLLGVSRPRSGLQRAVGARAG